MTYHRDGFCHPPIGESGRIPGGFCFNDDTGPKIYGQCDDGAGYCPAPDCVFYGPCVCPCHIETEGKDQ